MTTFELCAAAGLSRGTVQKWLESGLLQAANMGIVGGGVRRVFAPGQLERARLVKTLVGKGVSFGQLAAVDLAFDGQAFVVFDGQQLHGCRDAAAAIARVVGAKRWCSAVDLAAIRSAPAT